MPPVNLRSGDRALLEERVATLEAHGVNLCGDIKEIKASFEKQDSKLDKLDERLDKLTLEMSQRGWVDRSAVWMIDAVKFIAVGVTVWGVEHFPSLFNK